MHAHVLKLSGRNSFGRPKRSTKDVGEIFHLFKSGTEVNSEVNWHFPVATCAMIGAPVKDDGKSAVAAMIEKYRMIANRTELLFRLGRNIDHIMEDSQWTRSAHHSPRTNAIYYLRIVPGTRSTNTDSESSHKHTAFAFQVET